MARDPFDSSAGVPYDTLAEMRTSCPVARLASGDLQGGPVDRQVNANGLTARIQISFC